MYVSQLWHSQPSGFRACFAVVASSDISDRTAFLALPSRIEVGRARVEGADVFAGGDGGGDGLSVLQASQQRKLGGLTRVQMLQVQESSMGRERGAGFWCAWGCVGGGGLVEAGIGGFCSEDLCWKFWGDLLDSDFISIGAR